MIAVLPDLYLKNAEHFDSMCAPVDDLWTLPQQPEQCNNPACLKQQRCTCSDDKPQMKQQSQDRPGKEKESKLDQHQEVKKLIYQLMVKRCVYLASLPDGTSMSKEEAANELVRVLCVEIRAMDKDMRIFCAGLLTQIDECVPTQTVVQMMQKESMFEQKFVQISGTNSQPKSLTPSTVKSKPESTTSSLEVSPVVTGILLLMLEDDSMAVRLAGINAMSCFGRVCSEIRGKCLNHLIDMLNDEINDVRIASLHGIKRFNKVLTLNDYEVETVLFNLNEDNPRLREEIYLFFGDTTVTQTSLFTKILDKLYSNLIKFEHQDDTYKIFALVQKLGRSHSKLFAAPPKIDPQ